MLCQCFPFSSIFLCLSFCFYSCIHHMSFINTSIFLLLTCIIPYCLSFLKCAVQSLVHFSYFSLFISLILSLFPTFWFYSSFETLLNLVAMAANEASQICISMHGCVCVCAPTVWTSTKCDLDLGFVNHLQSPKSLPLNTFKIFICEVGLFLIFSFPPLFSYCLSQFDAEIDVERAIAYN